MYAVWVHGGVYTGVLGRLYTAFTLLMPLFPTFYAFSDVSDFPDVSSLSDFPDSPHFPDFPGSSWLLLVPPGSSGPPGSSWFPLVSWILEHYWCVQGVGTGVYTGRGGQGCTGGQKRLETALEIPSYNAHERPVPEE